MGKRKYIYYRTSNPAIIKRIREQFRIPKGISVNGETLLPDDFDTNDPLLQETARRGFIQIRIKET